MGSNPTAGIPLSAGAARRRQKAALSHSGFTDVDTSSGFCPHVEWIKNRLITLGCSIPGFYWGSDSVTRLQMAAFLRRLGDALAPVFVGAAQPSLDPVINANGVGCQTTPYAVQDYPRVASGTAMAYHSATTSQLVTARMVFSTDGGTTWQDFSDFHTLATNVPNGFVAQSPVTLPIDLAVGQSVIFGIRFGEFGGTPTVGDSGCRIMVRIESRTGSSSPLDQRQRTVQTH